MPVLKFRSFEEADRALWRRPYDPENLRILASITTTLRKLGGWTLPKGVFKYRSIEEADAAWEEVLHLRVRALAARRRATTTR